MVFVIIACCEEIIQWEREMCSCKRRKAKQAEQIIDSLPISHLKPSLTAFTSTVKDFGGSF